MDIKINNKEELSDRIYPYLSKVEDISKDEIRVYLEKHNHTIEEIYYISMLITYSSLFSFHLYKDKIVFLEI